MKRRNILPFVFFITVMITALVSCNSDDYNTGADEVKYSLENGTWKISNFHNSVEDKTADYTGYNFVFGSMNVLTAAKETNTYTGQWFVSNSTNDADIYSTIFKVSLSPNDIFQDLNADWKVIENTGSLLKLKDDSNGETAIDYLTFQKIE